MGQMDDGSECLLCELWQDLTVQMNFICVVGNVQDEIAWMLARRRAGDE